MRGPALACPEKAECDTKSKQDLLVTWNREWQDGACGNVHSGRRQTHRDVLAQSNATTAPGDARHTGDRCAIDDSLSRTIRRGGQPQRDAKSSKSALVFPLVTRTRY